MNGPYGRKLTWSFVLSSTYRLWSERFWTFFRIGLPIALLTYLFTPFQRILFRKLIGLLVQHGLVQFSPTYWVLLSAITFITGAVYWTLNALFFAGIAAKLINDVDDCPTLSDAYSRVRRRLRALLVVALLTWTVFQLARIIVGMAVTELMLRFDLPFSIFALAMLVGLPLLVIAGLVSRAALA